MAHQHNTIKAALVERRRRSRRISILRRLFEKSSPGLTIAASCDAHTHTVYLFIYLSSPVKSAHDYGRYNIPSRDTSIKILALSSRVCLYSVYISIYTRDALHLKYQIAAEEVFKSYSQVKQQQLGIWYSFLVFRNDSAKGKTTTHSLTLSSKDADACYCGVGFIFELRPARAMKSV